MISQLSDTSGLRGFRMHKALDSKLVFRPSIGSRNTKDNLMTKANNVCSGFLGATRGYCDIKDPQ